MAVSDTLVRTSPIGKAGGAEAGRGARGTRTQRFAKEEGPGGDAVPSPSPDTSQLAVVLPALPSLIQQPLAVRHVLVLLSQRRKQAQEARLLLQITALIEASPGLRPRSSESSQTPPLQPACPGPGSWSSAQPEQPGQSSVEPRAVCGSRSGSDGTNLLPCLCRSVPQKHRERVLPPSPRRKQSASQTGRSETCPASPAQRSREDSNSGLWCRGQEPTAARKALHSEVRWSLLPQAGASQDTSDPSHSLCGLCWSGHCQSLGGRAPGGRVGSQAELPLLSGDWNVLRRFLRC